MNPLKLLTIIMVTSSFFISTLETSAENKAAPKTQYTKTTYSKSKRRQAPVPQTKEYKVLGLHAWSEAKKNGFSFFPQSTSGQKTGVGEYGISKSKPPNNRRGKYKSRKNGSHMVGGVNMILYHQKIFGFDHKSYARFYLFYGKTLKQGWTVKEVKFSGSYAWDRRYKFKTGTKNIATAIVLKNAAQQTGSTNAMLKEIILVGPKTGRWQDAFDVM